ISPRIGGGRRGPPSRYGRSVAILTAALAPTARPPAHARSIRPDRDAEAPRRPHHAGAGRQGGRPGRHPRPGESPRPRGPPHRQRRPRDAAGAQAARRRPLRRRGGRSVDDPRLTDAPPAGGATAPGATAVTAVARRSAAPAPPSEVAQPTWRL